MPILGWAWTKGHLLLSERNLVRERVLDLLHVQQEDWVSISFAIRYGHWCMHSWPPSLSYVLWIKSIDMFQLWSGTALCSLFLHMCCKQDTEESQDTSDPSPQAPIDKSLLPIKKPTHTPIWGEISIYCVKPSQSSGLFVAAASFHITRKGCWGEMTTFIVSNILRVEAPKAVLGNGAFWLWFFTSLLKRRCSSIL